jgi:hypothetical protein
MSQVKAENPLTVDGLLTAHRNRRGRSSLLRLAGISWAIALLVGSFLLGKGAFGLTEHALGIPFEIAAAALGVWLGLLITWWARRRGRFDFFEFPVWFSLNAYVQIVLNVWLLQRTSTLRTPWAAHDPGGFAVQAVLLIGAGLTALWAGYAWFYDHLRGRSTPLHPVMELPRLKVVAAVWLVCWVITTGAVITGVRSYLGGASGFAGGYYLLFTEITGNLAAFVLMLYHFRHPSRLGWMWLVFASGSTILSGLVVGTKNTVFVLLYVIMAAYYSRGKLPKNWLVAGVVVLIVTVPIVNVFRVNLFGAGYDRSAGASFGERLPILAESVQQVLARPISTLAEETRTTFEIRQRGVFDFTAAVLAVHPSVRPYVAVDMLLLIAEQSIPRFLWLDKPATRPDLYMLSTQYLGLAEETSFTAPGQFADVYRTGGWPLVVLWFCVLGGLTAWLYRQGPEVRSLAGTAFYLVMLTQILSYEESMLSIARGVVQVGILLWIFLKYGMFDPAGQPRRRTLPGGRGRDEV